MYACVLICFSHVCFFVTLWTAARQAPQSMGFSRQEYWSGLPCPLLGDLPDPGIKPMSPVAPAWQVDSFSAEPLGMPTNTYIYNIKYKIKYLIYI